LVGAFATQLTFRGLPLLVALGPTMSPQAARAGLPHPHPVVGPEYGYVWFDPLADYTQLDPGTNLPENRRYELASANVLGLRVGLRLHEELDFLWSRMYATSRYRVFINGEEAQPVEDGVAPVRLPDVETRFDLFSFRYRPARIRLGPIQPMAGLGLGWLLLSQQGEFRPPGELPKDYSDSDFGWELSAGLESRWRWLRAGVEGRSFHWRWDPQDEFVPARTTHAWMLSAWPALEI
jgi:hypothetical protein